MKNRIELIQQLKKALKSKYGDRIKDVILFGSQASGTAAEHSDYDVLIIIREKPDWRFERAISDICYGIELEHNIFIDTLIISETELETIRGKQPIYQNALKMGIYA
jgi:predicted nucleotidyltransferase